MSTAGPLHLPALPLEPMPPATLLEDEMLRRRQEVAAQLELHRARRGTASTGQQQSQAPAARPARTSRVASSVAARFARSQSYRDFLAEEAERASRQAEAAAEVARRNAEAIVAAQRNLLDEMERWNTAEHAGTAELSDSVDAQAAPAPMAHEMAHEAAQLPATAVALESIPLESFAPLVAEPPAAPTVRELLADEPREPAVPLPANLIEFPRQLVAARKARPRLAEGPLREEELAAPEHAQLRIFEVDLNTISTEPAITSVTPEWASIRLDSPPAARAAELAEPEISFAIPLEVASLPRRMMSATVDACCVLSAFLLAVLAAAYFAPVLPTGVAAGGAAAATLAVFAPLYQLLFFTFSDATPGMRFARIALCTFGDENPTRAQMRRRIVALLLAAVPAGLGILWAGLDDEGLGWHDRISRMYQRSY